jgi:feruloyl-CoA synthase
MRLIAHFDGLLQDVVLAGPDRDYVAALFFPALSACRNTCGETSVGATTAELLARPEVRNIFQEKLNSFSAANSTNSTCVQRACLLDSPPSMEARELTDKGTINHAAVLKNRMAVVEQLYLQQPAAHVLIAGEGCSANV